MMNYQSRIDEALFTPSLMDGTIIPINKIISSKIGVPEGQYLIDSSSDDKCVLIPASEARGQHYEVYKPTLQGFFNAEIHKRVITPHNNDTIVED